MRQDIEQLKARNNRVEADKAWETSWTRRGIVAGLTYLVMVLFLWTIGTAWPWLNALVPTIGFVLSTLTLSVFKKMWLRKVYRI